ncbi:MAG TPA: hypothetical protein VMS93_10465 [Candidatus Saccharimonadales bacterium]|nr:hypothetical protein [Candidatus Saccharimonadales bacterium]
MPVPASELPPPIPTKGLDREPALAAFLDQLDSGWRSLLLNQRRCEVQARESDTCDPVRWSQVITEYLSTPEYVDAVRHRRGKVKSPELALRLERLWPCMAEAVFEHEPYLHQVGDPLQDSVVTFRAAVGGVLVSREQAREIMRHDEDRARRRAAFESVEPLSQKLGPDLRELIRRRNLVAQRLGYDGFESLALEGQGLTPRQMEALEDSLDLLTRAPYRELCAHIRARLGVFQLHAWDLIYGQGLLDVVADTLLRGDALSLRLRSFMAGLGFNPDLLPVRVFYQVNSPYGARCLPVDPPVDVRLMVSPRDGLNGVLSVFHEYGCGLQETYLPDPRPSTRALPEVWTEAVGNLFGGLPVEPGWLTGAADLSDSAAAATRRRWLASRLLSVRSLLMLSRFERNLYRDPDCNADSLWRACTEKYLEVEGPEASLWASETPILVQPLSYTRHLAAEAVGAQLRAAVHRQCALPEGACLGKFLEQEVYRPLAGHSWPEVLRGATGAALGARALADELGAAPAPGAGTRGP